MSALRRLAPDAARMSIRHGQRTLLRALDADLVCAFDRKSDPRNARREIDEATFEYVMHEKRRLLQAFEFPFVAEPRTIVWAAAAARDAAGLLASTAEVRRLADDLGAWSARLEAVRGLTDRTLSGLDLPGRDGAEARSDTARRR